MYISKKDFIQILEGDQKVIEKYKKEFKIGIFPEEKICKYCGKSFIPKGNYNTNYCDRTPNGENRSCKYLGAVTNRKNKLLKDPSLKEKEKEYKKMYARMRNGIITREEFETWKQHRNNHN